MSSMGIVKVLVARRTKYLLVRTGLGNISKVVSLSLLITHLARVVISPVWISKLAIPETFCGSVALRNVG